MPDLSNDEISVQGEYYRCDVCDIERRDTDLFDVDEESGTMVCAFGTGCQYEAPWRPSRTLPERDPDEGYDDAVDAALERTTNGNTN